MILSSMIHREQGLAAPLFLKHSGPSSDENKLMRTRKPVVFSSYQVFDSTTSHFMHETRLFLYRHSVDLV